MDSFLPAASRLRKEVSVWRMVFGTDKCVARAAGGALRGAQKAGRQP
ncbi:MAG: hypothetical protein AB7E55_36115 [Pigmentiphaga sp.]